MLTVELKVNEKMIGYIQIVNTTEHAAGLHEHTQDHEGSICVYQVMYHRLDGSAAQIFNITHDRHHGAEKLVEQAFKVLSKIK